MAQSVKHLPLVQVMIQVMMVRDGTTCQAPCSAGSLLLPMPLPLFLHSLSLSLSLSLSCSLSQMNKIIKESLGTLFVLEQLSLFLTSSVLHTPLAN